MGKEKVRIPGEIFNIVFPLFCTFLGALLGIISAGSTNQALVLGMAVFSICLGALSYYLKRRSDGARKYLDTLFMEENGERNSEVSGQNPTI